MRSLIPFCMVALSLLVGGCASKKIESKVPVTENIASGVTVQRDGNEMIFRRENEKKTVSAFHELYDIRFFSAAKARVIVAATRESGYPGWTLILFRLPPKESKHFTVNPVLADPKDGNGKKYVVTTVKGILDDGTKLMIAVQVGNASRDAVFEFSSGKVSFPK